MSELQVLLWEHLWLTTAVLQEKVKHPTTLQGNGELKINADFVMTPAQIF